MNADAVAQQPDKETLLQAMQSYAFWRETLPDELKDRIEATDPKDRRAAIVEAINLSESAIAKQSGAQLDDKTVEVIYSALQQFLRDRLPRDQRKFTARPGFGGMMVDGNTREFFAIHQRFGRRDSHRPPPRHGGSADESLTETELEEIESQLPATALETLEFLCSGDSLLKSMTLQIWVEEVIRRKMPWRDQTTPLQRYQTLTEAQREGIDLLPPDRMLQTLSRDRPPRN